MRPPPPLTIPQLAKRWQCSDGVVRSMIERNELRAIPLGPKTSRVSWEEIERIEGGLSGSTEGNGSAGSTGAGSPPASPPPKPTKPKRKSSPRTSRKQRGKIRAGAQ